MSKPLWVNPVRVVLEAAQALVWPWRLLGGNGTPERPIEYQAGDAVPWWVFLIYPLRPSGAVFVVDCDVAYDWRRNVVCVWPQDVEWGATVIDVNHEVAWVVGAGAPTLIEYGPNKRRRRLRATRVEEALA